MAVDDVSVAPGDCVHGYINKPGGGTAITATPGGGIITTATTGGGGHVTPRISHITTSRKILCKIVFQPAIATIINIENIKTNESICHTWSNLMPYGINAVNYNVHI